MKNLMKGGGGQVEAPPGIEIPDYPNSNHSSLKNGVLR